MRISRNDSNQGSQVKLNLIKQTGHDTLTPWFSRVLLHYRSIRRSNPIMRDDIFRRQRILNEKAPVASPGVRRNLPMMQKKVPFAGYGLIFISRTCIQMTLHSRSRSEDRPHILLPRNYLYVEDNGLRAQRYSFTVQYNSYEETVGAYDRIPKI